MQVRNDRDNHKGWVAARVYLALGAAFPQAQPESLPVVDGMRRALQSRAHFPLREPAVLADRRGGVDIPFDNYERMAEFMSRCKGKVM